MRVVIAEDDALLREGLVLLLGNEGIDVAAAVDNADTFLAAVSDRRPDAAIVDVRLPPSFSNEGLRAAVEARRRIPRLPILVLSAYVEDSYAADLLARPPGWCALPPSTSSWMRRSSSTSAASCCTTPRGRRS